MEMWKTESDTQETRGDTIILIAGRTSADVVLPLLIASIALITMTIFSCILSIQPSEIERVLNICFRFDYLFKNLYI